MNVGAHSYLHGIKENLPALPSGEQILEEGRELGNTIKEGKCLFLKENGYHSFEEYKNKCRKEGKIIWEILLGLGTLEEEIAGIAKAYEYQKRTGLELNVVQCIPSQLITLPKEYRENAPKPTSYCVEKPEDWVNHQAGVPMEIFFEDQHLSCPNALETTINAIKAGSERVGLISQFIWSQPGYTDHRQHMIDMVKSIGIVSSKKDKDFVVDTYLDDGLPGYAMDCVTYVGYALLEHYIVSQLCDANFQISWGGLLLGKKRLAVGLALHRLLSTEEHSAISYINGSTVEQWDHDIDANYGFCVQEMLMEALMEKKYRMGMLINPVSITEKLRVPTLQELLNIYSAGARSMEALPEWEDMMDWSTLENMADDLAEQGKKFFENTMETLESAGVNTKDPLEMFMVLKSINPSKFEMLFHPDVTEAGTLTPRYSTVLGLQTLEIQKEIQKELLAEGVGEDTLKGKKVVVASGDGHSYGLMLVSNVLSWAGAHVISGGVDIDAATLLDLAEEEEAKFVGVSVHIGQGLDYAKQLMKLSEGCRNDCRFFMGGKLNAILEGESEPQDVTEKIRELGVLATNDFSEIVAMMKE